MRLRSASRLHCQQLAHDALLPRVAGAVEAAVDPLGADADYTEVVRHLEEANGEDLRSPAPEALHPGARLAATRSAPDAS